MPQRLAGDWSHSMAEELVFQEIEGLISDGFVVRSHGNRLQRLNGWMPLHKRFVAVELKLKRVEEAMRQAWNNLKFVNESYVCLPRDLATLVLAKRSRWATFLNAGVGLLGATTRSCEVLIRSDGRMTSRDPVVQFCSIEKFWRTYPKGR